MEFLSPNICSPFVHYKQANQITFAIASFVAHDGQESNFLLWFLRCDLHRIQVFDPNSESNLALRCLECGPQSILLSYKLKSLSLHIQAYEMSS